MAHFWTSNLGDPSPFLDLLIAEVHAEVVELNGGGDNFFEEWGIRFRVDAEKEIRDMGNSDSLFNARDRTLVSMNKFDTFKFFSNIDEKFSEGILVKGIKEHLGDKFISDYNV